MRRLSSALSGFLDKKLNAGFPFRLAQLWERWDSLMGAELAALAKPLGHRKGTLLVGVEDPAALQELSYYEYELLDAVNHFLQQNYFDKIHIELLMGKVPLNAEQRDEHYAPRAPLRPPGPLGTLFPVLDPDSSLAKCYAAYVRLFQDQDAQPREKGRVKPRPPGRAFGHATEKKSKTTRKRRGT
jgi:hypothetical protein